MLRTCWLAGVALALLGGVAAKGQSREAEVNPYPFHQLIDGVVAVGETAQAEEYYLGVECLPVMPALRAQLNLPEKQGLLVGFVLPESPAAAGIAQHDILLRVGGKPLADPRELRDAVQAAKGGKLKIELIRGGKPKTIELAPAKRPAGPVANLPGAEQMPNPGDWETVQKWLQSTMPGQNGHLGQIRIVGPGAIVPINVLVQKPLPANMSVVVSRSGDQPAQIKVQRGQQKWELTEKQLDKLPADVRPFVEQMLGRGPFGLMGNVRTSTAPATPGQNVFYQSLPEAGRIDGRIEKRLDEMNQRIDKLFQLMEKMSAGHGDSPPK